MTRIDCEDTDRKDGFSMFTTGATIDVGTTNATYDVWLCVRVPGRSMSLYATPR